jgi:hypothetical protein
LPPGFKLVDAFATNTLFEFPASGSGDLSQMLQILDQNKSHYGITDWGIGQTTLEEVFVRLITDADATADA